MAHDPGRSEAVFAVLPLQVAARVEMLLAAMTVDALQDRTLFLHHWEVVGRTAD